jgi:hypothetical protein|tara:strand:- start:313 stop:486 length:174 start_codon:yes stop_codon:yes gene_type:complete
MEPWHQILVAPYDDGLLITIDGKTYFYNQTVEMQLDLAKELITRSRNNKKKGLYRAE